METTAIAQRIRELIDESMLSDAAFANMAKLNASNLHKKLQGKQSITRRDIAKICDNMNVSQEWLLNGTGEKYKSNNEVLSEVNSAILVLTKQLVKNNEMITKLRGENKELMDELAVLYAKFGKI